MISGRISGGGLSRSRVVIGRGTRRIAHRLAQLPEDLRAKIGHENAMKIYRFGQ